MSSTFVTTSDSTESDNLKKCRVERKADLNKGELLVYLFCHFIFKLIKMKTVFIKHPSVLHKSKRSLTFQVKQVTLLCLKSHFTAIYHLYGHNCIITHNPDLTPDPASALRTEVMILRQ